MTVQIEYTQDRGIYGKKSWTGFAPTLSSPFAVFKDETGWAIGHRKTGLSVCSLIPRGVRRTKTALLLLLAQMEADEPDAVAAMNEIEGFPIKGDVLRTAGKKLIDWRWAREGGA
jgi:hypothetical protein